MRNAAAQMTATPNHAMERTATRRVFTFVVARTFFVQVAHGLGGCRFNLFSLGLKSCHNLRMPYKTNQTHAK